MPEPTKTCSRCREVKPLTEFYERRDRPGQRVAQCKRCDSKRAAAANAVRREDPDYKARQDEQRRHQSRRQRYGMTQQEVEAAEAIERCEACGRTAEEVGHRGKSGVRLHFDHHHDTGRFRGVLCKPCNSVLGMVDDDRDRLLALADYLRRSHP